MKYQRKKNLKTSFWRVQNYESNDADGTSIEFCMRPHEEKEKLRIFYK